MSYKIVYPERRTVSAEQMLMWGQDAFANGELDTKPSTADEAAIELHELGNITLHADSMPSSSDGGPPYDHATATGMYDHW